MYKDKDYKNIFYLVLNHRLMGNNKYQELVPYDHILYNLFNSISMVKDLSLYVKECVELVMRIPNPNYNLDPVLLGICSNFNHPFKTVDNLEIVFFPNEVINEEDGCNVGYFISTFSSLLLKNEYVRNNYSFHYEKFNNIFLYYKSIISNKELYDYFDIVVTLLSSVYYYDLDYKIVDEYLSDPEYYNDVFEMMGLIFNENNKGNYYSIMYKRLFENSSKIFHKNKLLIK